MAYWDAQTLDNRIRSSAPFNGMTSQPEWRVPRHHGVDTFQAPVSAKYGWEMPGLEFESFAPSIESLHPMHSHLHGRPAGFEDPGVPRGAPQARVPTGVESAKALPQSNLSDDFDKLKLIRSPPGTPPSPSRSLPSIYHLRQNPPSNNDYAVLRLKNVPWNISIHDIRMMFQPIPMMIDHIPPAFTQGVHIIMDRKSGKTHADAFVEFPNYLTALKALEIQSKVVIKGRLVTTQWSSQNVEDTPTNLKLKRPNYPFPSPPEESKKVLIRLLI
ncbi:hypothetical protein HDV05_008432 [Chytridiales sp. JEL 0842]|nr:hypothetical protein HDV05_008432 [Chytridiales sp. JEL 0842]